MCAKHIVSSGLKELVYIEPYAKSYALALHGDSIALDKSDETHVGFIPFTGVSPFRYRDFFEKGKRKYSSGLAKPFADEQPRPRVDNLYQNYLESEIIVVKFLGDRVEAINGAQETPSPKSGLPKAPKPGLSRKGRTGSGR